MVCARAVPATPLSFLAEVTMQSDSRLMASGGIPTGWIDRLKDRPIGVGDGARRFLIGCALAASYGVALGSSQGPLTMAAAAVGVPSAFVVVALLGGPAAFILLTHAGANVTAAALAAVFGRAVASCGLVLAGLAPTAALLVLSVETSWAAALSGLLGLLIGGGVGMAELVRAMNDELGAATLARKLVVLGLATFAVLVAGRVWTAVLWAGAP